jgi:hypothetical protein
MKIIYPTWTLGLPARSQSLCKNTVESSSAFSWFLHIVNISYFYLLTLGKW